MKENSIEQKILQVAEKEFLLKGYMGARTIHIAEQVGVSHSMLHYYYRTKEALFNKVFEDKLNMVVASMIEAFNQPHQSFFDRIKIGIEKQFDFLVQNPGLPRFIINEMTSNPNYKDTHARMIQTVEKSIIGIRDEMKKLEEQGVIEKMYLSDLILNIISMNVFVFIIPPCIQEVIFQSPVIQEAFLEHRRKENVEVIMRRLRKL